MTWPRDWISVAQAFAGPPGPAVRRADRPSTGPATWSPRARVPGRFSAGAVPHQRGQSGDELVHVGFLGVERAHQPDDTRLLVPDVEGPLGLQLLDDRAGKHGEHPVGLHGVGQGHPGHGGHAGTQPGGHGVGVGCTAQPQVVGQQGDELGGDEAHLRGQLHRLLAEEAERRWRPRGGR